MEFMRGKFCRSCLYALRVARDKKRGQQRAHHLVNRAIVNGKLPKLNGSVKCKDCGMPASIYDHRDYRKPLRVDPVCTFCNARRGSALPKTGLSKRYLRREVIMKKNLRGKLVAS